MLIAAILGYFLYNRFFYFGELIGIKGTDTYHRSSCIFIKKSSIEKLIFFDSIDDTVPDRRPCKACHLPNNSKQVKAFNAEYEEEQRLKAETEAKRIVLIKERFSNGVYVSPSDRELIGESSELTMEDVEMAISLPE